MPGIMISAPWVLNYHVTQVCSLSNIPQELQKLQIIPSLYGGYKTNKIIVTKKKLKPNTRTRQ